MPVSLTHVTALLSVKMYTTAEHDFCTTCYERPPVLRDRFCWAEGVVAQDRFYCNYIVQEWNALVKSVADKNSSNFEFWFEFIQHRH